MKMRLKDIGGWLAVPGLVMGLGGPVLAKTSVSRDIEAPVQRAVDTRQASQKQVENWDGERAKLVAAYEKLKNENEQLRAVRARLSKEKAGQEEVNRALAAEQMAADRIQDELLPFLKETAGRLDELVNKDTPFLFRERTSRLAKLRAILDDSEVSGAEKYRKTMEALFVEAEYGNTIEVYQEKIILDDAEVLGNIFRLGRVSLFFLSLDRERAGVFNVADGRWAALDHSQVPAIAGAVDMAAKHRPMEVISLPVGALSRGGSHD